MRWDNIVSNIPDSKVHGAKMGPLWGRQDPGGRHVGTWTLLSGTDRESKLIQLVEATGSKLDAIEFTRTLWNMKNTDDVDY